MSWLERVSGRIAPRATKVLGIFVMLAAIKLGILVFMGLDLLLPDPPVQVAQRSILPAPFAGPTPVLAQQKPGNPLPPATVPPSATPPANTSGAPDSNALLKRQDELDQREQALKSLEAELNSRVAKLKEMETSIKGMLEEAKGVKDQKLKHLIDVYSNMNAKQAAKVLETLDNGIAVKILAGMRGRQAGDVLNNMEAKKAAGLTEMLTKIQLPPQDGAGPGAM
ncbi:MotE family protein [Desulfovibrio sp. TomC]|uniref:MotE family protein n=1 Tax=Desulfovibrio sp. TomC TaxID=1562888 RepID=UPI00057572CA|nr:MotE family protein [Desulfovibrio sp. TomC]KHK01239.1 Flagellar protein FlbB [Desulfovibrio sp. TomC]